MYQHPHLSLCKRRGSAQLASGEVSGTKHSWLRQRLDVTFYSSDTLKTICRFVLYTQNAAETPWRGRSRDFCHTCKLCE